VTEWINTAVLPEGNNASAPIGALALLRRVLARNLRATQPDRASAAAIAKKIGGQPWLRDKSS